MLEQRELSGQSAFDSDPGPLHRQSESHTARLHASKKCRDLVLPFFQVATSCDHESRLVIGGAQVCQDTAAYGVFSPYQLCVLPSKLPDTR